MKAAIRQLLFGSSAWTPAGLFRSGAQGAWYDPSNLGSMYQDSAGTTPVTAVGQPVGLRLDMRNGLARGANLVTNGSFDANLSGWADASTAPATVAWSAGAAQFTRSDTNNARLDQQLTTVANTWYVVQADVGAGAPISINIGTAQGGSTLGAQVLAAGGTRSVWFMATGATTWVRFITQQVGTTTVDNVAAQPVLGNHATQSTSTSRPTLQQDAGGRYYLSYDGVDDGMATASIDFTGTDKMTVFAGVYKASDATTNAVLAELSGDYSANNGSFAIFAPGAASTYGFRARNSLANAASNTGASYAAPHAAVVTESIDLSNTATTLTGRVNGGGSVTAGAGSGGGNFGNYPLYIGRRGGNALPFNGRDYGLIVLGRAATATEIARTEKWLAARMGIAL